MEKAIFTNMCMVEDGRGNLLVQNRLNPNWPGITFPGGHVEPGESFVESVIREVREETGLEIRRPRLCGIKQFQTAEGDRYVVLFFKTSDFSGILTGSSEGDVFWVPRDRLEEYPLADDFEKMLRVFENENLSEIFYCQDQQEWQARLL